MEVNIARNNVGANQASGGPGCNHPLPSKSQLPTELLAEILQLSLPEIDFKSNSAFLSSRAHVKRLYIMRSVTKRWQAVIEGTPSFWTIIAFELPSHVNEASILRSENLPLFVICHNGVFQNPDHHRSGTEFLELIQTVRPRWSTLILVLYDPTALLSCLEAPSPLLRTIIVRNFCRSRIHFEPMELLGGVTSNLRYVELLRVSIRWKMGCFVQLKCLNLSDVDQNDLKTQQLLDAIRASPGLQVLKLTRVIVKDIPQPSPTITLQHLKYIKLDACNNRLVDYILRVIQAPSCTRLSLGTEDPDGQLDAPDFLNNTLKPFHSILRDIHKLHGESEIVLDARGIAWQTQGDSDMEGFWIKIQHSFDPLFTDWVGCILKDETGLRIIFGFGCTNSEAVLRSIASMRPVTKVVMQGGWRGANVLPALKFLGEPLATSPSLPSLPCLREILFPERMGWSTRELLEMVQSRFCTLGWEVMERTPLTINVQREGPGRVLDLATILNIREITGVESFKLVGRKAPEDIMAVVWDEEDEKGFEED